MKDTPLSSLQHELDLANAQMQQMHSPVTYIIDPLNTTRMTYVEVDYKRRLEPAKILDFLSSLYNEV